MLINSVPISEYGAKQLTLDFAPSTVETTYEWNPGARIPVLVDRNETFKNATITLKVTGGNRQEVNKQASHIHALAVGESEYIFDGYKGWVFVGSLSEAPTLTKTVDRHVYKLTLKLTGYMREVEQCEEELNRTTQGYIHVKGTRETPIILEVTPVFDLPEFTISGVAENGITVKNMTAGNTIFIDGITGLVTEGGQNKFKDVVMFEFPYLRPGEQTIEFSESVCNVKIRYFPMWL